MRHQFLNCYPFLLHTAVILFIIMVEVKGVPVSFVDGKFHFDTKLDLYWLNDYIVHHDMQYIIITCYLT